MKNQRQEYLLQIIAEETVETQEQLLERLQERSWKRCTKAVIKVPRPPFPGTSRSCTSLRSR